MAKIGRAVAVCAGVFIGLLAYHIANLPSENKVFIAGMADSIDEKRAEFQKMNKAAFVLGATGEVGKELVKEMVSSKVFSRIVLIGRREVQFEDGAYKELVEQKVVDFDKLDEFADAFQGFDVGFCCLGTTRGKAGAKGFYKVDHDYVLNAGRLAKAGGCQHFHLVSSQGASKNSWLLYPKTKGEIEAHLGDLGFSRLSIYRPAMLLCDRVESRPMEHALRSVLTPVAKYFPTAISIPTSTVAKAMVNAAVTPDNDAVRIFSNADIHNLSGDLKSGKKATESETKAAGSEAKTAGAEKNAEA